jgi:hypothetical protein
VNFANTACAIFLKNPFAASVPGGIFKVSISSVFGDDKVFNSPLEAATWKSIGLNTLGNVMGDHMSGHILGGMAELGVRSSGKIFLGSFRPTVGRRSVGFLG